MSITARQATVQHLLATYELEYERQRRTMLRFLEPILSFDDQLKPAPGRGCGYNKFSPKGRARRS